ncbi:TPA: hypothetical protein ACX6SJ_003859 [Photobacterium damselae]
MFIVIPLLIVALMYVYSLNTKIKMLGQDKAFYKDKYQQVFDDLYYARQDIKELESKIEYLKLDLVDERSKRG